MSALLNIEAEAALLGAMMQENSVIDRVADKLTAADFAEPAHSALFDIITQQAAKGEKATPVTLAPHWSAVPNSDALGGNRYLLTLTSDYTGALAFDSILSQIAELSKRRKMAEGLQQAADMAADINSDIADAIRVADNALNDSETGDGVEQLSAIQCADNLWKSYTDTKNGVSCHIIPELDRIAGKLRPKELIVLAARPGMGKTAVALSYALGAAQAGFGVLYVSLEMSGTELAARMISDLCFDGRAGVPYSNIRDGDLSDNQRTRMRNGYRMLRELPLHVVDAGKLTTGRLGMIVRRTKRRMEARGETLDLVIVDYLQLLSTDQSSRGIYEKVSEISMALKAIAKTYAVPVMALAQLSREVEKRPDKTPQLSDLRDSGQIEQDADAVLFLVRQNYYHQFTKPEPDSFEWAEWEADNEASKHDIDFICAKRRNGETGKSRGRFYGAFQAVRGAS